MTPLNGNTALVTGASRGIGRAIASRLADDGAEVAVHFGTNQTAADEVVDSIERKGGKAHAIRAEFGADGDLDALFDQLRDWLDGRPLDILVNSAALARSTGTHTIHEIAAEIAEVVAEATSSVD